MSNLNNLEKVLPPLPVNLLLIFMRFERSLVFLFSGEYALFFGGYSIAKMNKFQ